MVRTEADGNGVGGRAKWMKTTPPARLERAPGKWSVDEWRRWCCRRRRRRSGDGRRIRNADDRAMIQSSVAHTNAKLKTPRPVGHYRIVYLVSPRHTVDP